MRTLPIPFRFAAVRRLVASSFACLVLSGAILRAGAPTSSNANREAELRTAEGSTQVLKLGLVRTVPGGLVLLPSVPVQLPAGTAEDLEGGEGLTVHRLAWDLGQGWCRAVLRAQTPQDLTISLPPGLTLSYASVDGVPQAAGAPDSNKPPLTISLPPGKDVDLALTFVRHRAPRTLKLACVGDSITAGYALAHPDRDAYPVRLAHLLGTGWEVRNFGVSGATLMHLGGYPYDQRPAHAEALAWKPDVVVIALGTNDTKAENIPVHPGDFIPSYKALIERFRSANPGVRILLCLPPPAFPAAMGIAEDVLAKEILPRIREVASEEHLPLIDLHDALALDGAHFPDRIHPDPAAAERIAEVVYGGIMKATQPRATALASEVNTAIVPATELENDSYNWWERHAAELDARVRLAPEVVLVGDSITHFWGGEPAARQSNGPKAWARYFGALRAMNLGFGWDRTENVLWRIDHGEFDGLRPKLVILNIGTNNFTGTIHSRVNTPAEVAEAVLAIRARLQEKCPGAHLLVMGVLPRGYSHWDASRGLIRELNAILARRLAGLPDVTFLDIGNRFLKPDGDLIPGLLPDGTHPSEEGYTIWGEALEKSGLLPAK